MPRNEKRGEDSTDFREKRTRHILRTSHIHPSSRHFLANRGKMQFDPHRAVFVRVDAERGDA